MRTFKQNADIIKAFMVYGAEYFYLNYYIDGEDFINNIHISKQDVKYSIALAEQAQEDFDNGYISDNEMINNIIKVKFLTSLVEIDNTKVTEEEFKLYQYLADGIVGNIEAMFTLLRDITEHKHITEETVELAEEMVYVGIRELWLFAAKASEHETN